MATELIRIRHSQAIRVNGDYFHAPLTQLGQEQAAATGQYFREPQKHLDGFYSRPLAHRKLQK
jgi:broad specificity phosphatase PhoE